MPARGLPIFTIESTSSVFYLTMLSTLSSFSCTSDLKSPSDFCKLFFCCYACYASLMMARSTLLCFLSNCFIKVFKYRWKSFLPISSFSFWLSSSSELKLSICLSSCCSCGWISLLTRLNWVWPFNFSNSAFFSMASWFSMLWSSFKISEEKDPAR